MVKIDKVDAKPMAKYLAKGFEGVVKIISVDVTKLQLVCMTDYDGLAFSVFLKKKDDSGKITGENSTLFNLLCDHTDADGDTDNMLGKSVFVRMKDRSIGTRHIYEHTHEA
tara:strand:- start:1759 stop:2091 length:333 start_codon:yes stop_codon:yes gene_type:complete